MLAFYENFSGRFLKMGIIAICHIKMGEEPTKVSRCLKTYMLCHSQTLNILNCYAIHSFYNLFDLSYLIANILASLQTQTTP
jgi:hypothetical protein